MSGRSAAGLMLAAALAVAWAALHAPWRTGSRHRDWMIRAMLAFALPTLVVLAVTDRLDALWRLPPELAPAAAAFPTMASSDLIGGALAGLALGIAVAAVRVRRGARPIGRPGALTPRSRDELGAGAAVAIVAGLVEEPFFRLLLPLLIAQASGSALLGFAVSTAVFAALHRYQGWRGMLATGLFGAVMVGVYLIGGMLWLVVLIHIVVDLNGLVLWPALTLRRQGITGPC